MNEPVPEANPPEIIEIGLILAGKFKPRDKRTALRATKRMTGVLQTHFPDYSFQVELSVRRDIGEYRREESSQMLRQAADLRTVHAWDFALLITPDELIARIRTYSFAALSRPLDAAVVSTARLIPSELATDPGTVEEDLPDEVVVDRLATVLLHAIAHLSGLPASRNKTAYLYHPQNERELDAMEHFSDNEVLALDRAFADIADERLEEQRHRDDTHQSRRWRFMLRAAWINRADILKSVVAARPWEFPMRLSRLTTAAVSTLALLLMTAESWDLGLSQGVGSLIAMAVLVLAGTTAFVVSRQGLMMRRHHDLREQLITTRISAGLIVALGLAITWLCIHLMALAATSLLFHPALVASWAASNELDPASIGFEVAWRMASFCATICLLIGSLGASFEEQWHFQHVIFVDEEL